MWTGMMSSCAEPSIITAGVYATQVRKLGVLMETKFDLKLDSTAGARNDLTKMVAVMDTLFSTGTRYNLASVVEVCKLGTIGNDLIRTSNAHSSATLPGTANSCAA